MNTLRYRPKEYQELVHKLIEENHQICSVKGLPATFFSSTNGVDVLSNFDIVFNSFVRHYPHSHKLSKDQMMFTFKILLQQELDRYWYDGFKTYQTNLEVYNDESLVCFADSEPLFTYLKLENGEESVSKIDKLKLTIQNSSLKNSMGMFLPYAPKAMFNFLNQLCLDLDISLVITNVLRSKEYQNRLIKNGHITPTESSHLYGYTVDIEQKWYRENRPKEYKKIVNHLNRLESDGRINYIDYSQIWHICLSPCFIHEYLD